MYDILYKPGFQKLLTQSEAIVDLCWNDSPVSHIGIQADPSRQETLLVRQTRLYTDLSTAVRKLVATKLGWTMENVKTIYLSVSTDLLKEKALTMEHVICKVLNGFFPEGSHLSQKVVVIHEGGHNASIEKIVRIAKKVTAGRMLALLPANYATPRKLCSYIRESFSDMPNMKYKVLKQAELHKKGFGLLLSVGNSSNNKPVLCTVIRKALKKERKRIAIVGKGITFDSGGLAIKSFHHMVDMKFDKIGAVYAAMALQYLCESPEWDDVTFIGVFPLAENAVSETATHPGDVVRSYIGKTVEVTNPDAEGRLILADALGYVEKDIGNIDLMIDVATLTGHASSINCWHKGYFYCNDEQLRNQVEKITNMIGERMLPMPAWDDYEEVLKSNVADISNSPLECGDSFVAAMFLKQFVATTKKWVHIDLAHETDNKQIPAGNGMRTMIAVCEHVLRT